MIVTSPPRNEEEYDPIKISADYDNDDMHEQLDSEDEGFRNAWAEVENECPEGVTASTSSQPPEIEEKQKKLQQIQNHTDAQINLSSSSLNGSNVYPPALSAEEKAGIDGRSVYVGNVDYGCTGEELKKHFHGCGSVSRVTRDMRNATAMDESLLRGRQIKVCQKRTNKPGISTTNRPPRFRGGPRGRGGAAGGMFIKYVPIGFGRPRGHSLWRRPNFFGFA